MMVSFDIDGTMEFGDPPGPLSVDLVRRARALGYTIGSASDRPIRNQRDLWEQHDIEMDFITLKHNLKDVREQMPPADRYLHIGDTEVDRHFAKLAGFDFSFGHEVADPETWLD